MDGFLHDVLHCRLEKSGDSCVCVCVCVCMCARHDTKGGLVGPAYIASVMLSMGRAQINTLNLSTLALAVSWRFFLTVL